MKLIRAVYVDPYRGHIFHERDGYHCALLVAQTDKYTKENALMIWKHGDDEDDRIVIRNIKATLKDIETSKLVWF